MITIKYFNHMMITFIKKYVIQIIVLSGVIILAIHDPRLLTINNIFISIIQSTVLGIASIGMTFVVIAGGFDLSIGSVAALSSMFASLIMIATESILLGIFGGLAVGICAGLINGFLVAFARMSPFIVTLGMLVIARATALAVTDGRPIVGLPILINKLANSSYFGIPNLVLLFIIIFILAHILLTYTKLGIQIYAIGSNKKACELAGLNIKLITIITFCISGFTASVAGLIVTARLCSGQPTSNTYLELYAMAAVVLGGNSLLGGRGNLIITLFGVFVIIFLQRGMNLANINLYFQQVVLGLVLIITASSELLRSNN